MAKWVSYFKFITPQPGHVKMTDSQEMADAGAYNNYTWYQRLVQGSASRMTRYREYDLMDNDVEVSRALDTMAEEMSGNNPKTDDPIDIDILSEDEEHVESSAVLTINAALRRWNQIHDWENKIFDVSRMTLKYGDCFFKKGKTPFEKWQFIHPKNVIAAIVDAEDATKVVAWQVKKNANKPKSGGYGLPIGAKQEQQFETEILDAREVVRFTLNDDMSDTAPFGESVLRPVYRAHKQKELLEDAIIIYRVQRAPERRAFYIDVGKMPPQRVKQYLETIKNEIKQKKIPNMQGGQMEVDSVYNPHSMSEDFYFASRPDGRGTKVEVLPGGQGLGELSDLEYFQKKVWRGLKVPASYMLEQQDGGQIFNDGKVGVAYIQELRFALYIMRLQGRLEKVFDEEFKKFLKEVNVFIDESMYRLRLPEPSNFGKYRQFELDSQLLSSYGSADGIQYFSKRFILKRFLMLTDEEIIRNERMLREERGLDPDGGKEDYQQIYGGGDQMGGMGGGLGGGGMMGGGLGGMDMGMEAGGMEGDMGAEGGAAGGEAGAGAEAGGPPPGEPA
jgi:hypothetical protein